MVQFLSFFGIFKQLYQPLMNATKILLDLLEGSAEF